MSARLMGLEASYALFASLPDLAQAELKETLQDLAKDALEIQQSLVPQDTGTLKGALSIKEAIESLRMRIGLIGEAATSKSTKQRLAREAKAGSPGREAQSFGALFYGRIVELGRKAQTVWVTRGTTASPKSWSSQKRAKAKLTVRKPYKMQVRAMAARPFVHIESRMDAVVNNRISGFWNNLLNRGGAA